MNVPLQGCLTAQMNMKCVLTNLVPIVVCVLKGTLEIVQVATVSFIIIIVRTCHEFLDLDIDECVLEEPCGPNAACNNTDGNYTCDCDPGYELFTWSSCGGMFSTRCGVIH